MRGLRSTLVMVGLAVAAWTAIAIPARATYGARVTADEPQYLLSAISLGEDLDLDISDELSAERYRPFHEANLPVQTKRLADGREVSPHDPLLPVVLAVPVRLGGWIAAKAALGVLAGCLAALLVWTAVRRFSAPVAVAAGVVLAFGVTSPLAPYAAQVYPELPAALLVTLAVAALTTEPSRASVAVATAAIASLPWLSVKYAPVVAALAAVAAIWLVRVRRWRLVCLAAAGLACSAVAYAVFHRVVYGGWTPYAAGDYFVGGEFTVVGVTPNYPGRSTRLIGLLVDREFGLAAWAPDYLLAVPAMACLLRRRPAGWMALAAPFAAGWLTATFVALTMHGWWWPGRQVVVVIPCVVLAAAWWIGAVRAARPGRVARFVTVSFILLAIAGAVMWAWLVVEVLAHQRTLVVDFFTTADPLYRAWSSLLPRYRHPSTGTWILHACWLLVAGGLALAGWRSIPTHQGAPHVPNPALDGRRARAAAVVAGSGVRQ